MKALFRDDCTRGGASVPHSYNPTFTIIAVVVVTGALSALNKRRSPQKVGLDENVIAPGKFTAYFTIAGGALMGLGGIFAIGFGLYSHTQLLPFIGAALALMGFAIAYFMLPSLTQMHVVKWNNQGIDGPNTMFGPTLGRGRTRMNWTEIVRTGRTITSYWFVEAADGQRIYWSYLYNGFGALTDAIREHCPSIKLQDGM